MYMKITYEKFVEIIDKAERNPNREFKLTIDNEPILNFLIERSNSLYADSQAIRSAYKQMLDYFFTKNVKVKLNQTRARENPLFTALKCRDYNAAEILIRRGADINLQLNVKLCDSVHLIHHVINACDNYEYLARDGRRRFHTEDSILELLHFFKTHGADYDPSRLSETYSGCKFIPHTVKIYESIVNSNFKLISSDTLYHLIVFRDDYDLVFQLMDLGADIYSACTRYYENRNLLQRIVLFGSGFSKGSKKAELIKRLIRAGMPIDSADIEHHSTLDTLLNSIVYYTYDPYTFEMIIKNGGVFRHKSNPTLIPLRAIISYRTVGGNKQYNYYAIMQVLYNYYGCERDEVVQSMLEELKERVEIRPDECLTDVINFVESWDIPTLRTLCLRKIKTKQCGDDYKNFAKGYFEWFPGNNTEDD